MYALLLCSALIVVVLTMTELGRPIVDKIGLNGIIIAVAAFAGLLIFFNELVSEMFVKFFQGSYARPRLANRRRMHRDPQRRTRAEIKLDAMDDAALGAFIEKNPRDALAIEIRCERLKRQGRTEEFARELEYFITLPSNLSVEEKATLYHELAELYLGPLNQPERGRAALQAIASEFPRSYQASLARRRLELIADAAAGEPKKPA